MKIFSNGNPLPTGWKREKIGNICEVATGGTPDTTKPEYYEGGTIRWLKSGDVKGTRILEVPNRITELGLSNSNAVVHPVGSVMLAMSGQGKTRGTSAILGIPSACSQSVAAILPCKQALPEIIHFALVSMYDEVRHITGDNERTGLNLRLIRDIQIPLPPLAEQRRIAAILEKADRLRRQRRYALELSAGYLQAVFVEMFYGQQAQEWPVETVEALARAGKNAIRTGPFGSQLLHSEFVDKGIPVLDMVQVYFTGFDHAARGTAHGAGSCPVVAGAGGYPNATSQSVGASGIPLRWRGFFPLCCPRGKTR